MNAGRIEQIGTPREVYARPKTRFVAEFIGSPPMNFLPGQSIGSSAAWVGVRPEVLAITTDQVKSSDDSITLEGTLLSVEDLGADRFAHVALDGPTEARTVVTRDVRGIIPDSGTRVSVCVARHDLHYFDQDGQVVQLT